MKEKKLQRSNKGRFLIGNTESLGGPIGNQKAQKLTTPELRQEAYRQYCKWLSQGKSKESWCFEHPDISLTSKTMEKYINDFPSELPIIKKEIAETKSYEVWENYGLMMMLGQVDKCQPAIYQMFMRNKFGWDKEQRQQYSYEPEARRLLAHFDEASKSVKKDEKDEVL